MINVAKRMKHLHTLAKRDPRKRFTALWKMMTTEEWLAQAWEEIRTNKGSQTPGIDGHTAADVDLDRIRQLSARLRAGTYRPKPVRRVYIPKDNGKTRSLGVLTIEDRLVQQALRMVLEPIFEADFLPCSHGFRYGRSPQTALRQVVQLYPKVSWIIETDVTACFDNIPRNQLMCALQRRIADGRILSLVKRFLEAGYMEDWRYHRTYSGIAQGGILSPLLCNVFLHHLDEYLINTLGANRPQTAKEDRVRLNPAIVKLNGAIARARRKLRGRAPRADRRRVLDTLRRWEQERRRTPRSVARHPTKLGYVRYGDDSVMLVNGTKAEAEDVKRKVKTQLATMGLTLNEEKTKLTHWAKPITFLGYHIRGQLRVRGVSLKAVLYIPKAKEKRLRQELRKVASSHHIPELDAMWLLNAKFQGWCHYYRYANNPQPSFNRVAQQLWWYYAHYLARQHRLSIRKLVQWGKRTGHLKVVKKGPARRGTFVTQVGTKQYYLDLFPPKTVMIYTVSGTTPWTVDLKPLTPANWQRGRSALTRWTARIRSAGHCERCGKLPVWQVHHRSRLGTKRTALGRIRSDRDQRSTALALCKECHYDVHHGGE